MMKKNPNPKKNNYKKRTDKKRIEKLLKWYGVDLTTLNLKEKEVNKKMNEFSLATTTPEEQTAPLTVINDDEGINFVVDLTSRQTSYCSMVAETVEEKAKLYNATNSTEYRIKDHINEVLEVKDVFVEVVKCTNQETGEVSTCPRTVLIDVNGNGYQAVSLGIFSALKKLFNIFGEPKDWDAPLKLKIRQISHGTRNILTFDIVS